MEKINKNKEKTVQKLLRTGPARTIHTGYSLSICLLKINALRIGCRRRRRRQRTLLCKLQYDVHIEIICIEEHTQKHFNPSRTYFFFFLSRVQVVVNTVYICMHVCMYW